MNFEFGALVFFRLWGLGFWVLGFRFKVAGVFHDMGVDLFLVVDRPRKITTATLTMAMPTRPQGAVFLRKEAVPMSFCWG